MCQNVGRCQFDMVLNVGEVRTVKHGVEIPCMSSLDTVAEQAKGRGFEPLM
jgi:hypothetical protein